MSESEMVTWLRAQIEERKQAALTAFPGPWAPDADGYAVVCAEDGEHVADGFSLSNRQLRATVVHIALNDPCDVIARCDAELAILDLHEPIIGDGINYTWAEQNRAEDVINLLAQGYRHRPGYQEERSCQV